MKKAFLLEEHLRALRLPSMLEHYGRLAEGDTEKVKYLGDLSALEVDKRQEKRIHTRITTAKFPVLKTLESFDFQVQTSLSKSTMLKYTDGEFIRKRENLIFLGPTGVGKTHLLTALGLSACESGYRVVFTTAAEMCLSLITAQKEGQLKQKSAYYQRCDLLLIDELGYVPFAREASDLLFGVISKRYERASIAITTNLAFTDWTQIFPDAMAASAAIDRLVHHGHVIEMSGESYRLRSRQEGRKRQASKATP